MNDTRMTQAWIQDKITRFPCAMTDTGQIRTCPVRLSFPAIFKKSKPIPPNTEGTYGACLLFPKGANLAVLIRAAQDAALSQWPKPSSKLKNPFLSQNDMLQYGGFEEGATYVRAVAYENQPVVYDQQRQRIIDPARVYPGVWAVAMIRPFTFDKGVNRGVSFGLNSVMLVADDQPLGGGVSDPEHDFAGINIEAEMQVDAMFGADPRSAAAAREEAARRALFG